MFKRAEAVVLIVAGLAVKAFVTAEIDTDELETLLERATKDRRS